MTPVNRGKDFENQIREGFESVPGVSVDRLIDPMAGYAGVRNICDFIVYKEPYINYIECKSCYGNTLPFTNITDNQWKGLLEKSQYPGINAGVIVWFIDHDKTVYVPIQTLQALKCNGYKSLNITHDWEKYDSPLKGQYLYILGDKRRILFNYDMDKFLRHLYCREDWRNE